MFNINKVREDFPILSREVYNKPLVYLDNAATTQKPLCVLDAMRDEYLNVNANVHRGVHYLSQQATDLHEAAREKVRQFINASKIEEIVFTRGTTEAINLVAQSFCESQMQAGDEVIVTEMEHHSNIVSWQLQAMKRGIIVKHIPIRIADFIENKNHQCGPCEQCIGHDQSSRRDHQDSSRTWDPRLSGWCPECTPFQGGCAGDGLRLLRL